MIDLSLSASPVEAQPAGTSLASNNWRDSLDTLAATGFPLLAVGAGAERKAPADPATGRPLRDWQHASHTTSELKAAHPDVCSVGTRTGDGLLVFDIDGESALSWLLERDCDPALTTTWQIHRTTDPARLKVAFRLTGEQQQQLGQLKRKTITADAIKSDGQITRKGEAVELFHQPGSQVIVLGEHPSSGGHYYWPDGMGPETLSTIPECWWKAAHEIVDKTITASRATRHTSKGDWKALPDCPICGRNTTSYCAIHQDGKTIRCFHGSTFSPPTGLRAGEEITDRNGQIWAFSREQQQNGGDVFSVFVMPDPERRAKQQQSHDTRVKAINSTGIDAVVEAKGIGWVKQEDGPPKRQKIAVGDLSGRLRQVLGDRLGFDELAMLPAVDGVALEPHDIELLHVRLSENGWIIAEKAAVDALMLTARERPFHPIREYLKRVEADRSIAPFDLNEVATKFFRVSPDSPLHIAMVRRWLIGAVARAMEPGCQMDHCLVLQGGQGLGKSTALRALASPDWFCCTVPDQDKDLTLNVHNCWIYELAELEALTGRKAAGHLKNMLTTATDLVRVPFGKAPERLRRSSVFAATVNKREFLRDDTGNRRFWVVPIEGTEKLDREGLAGARDAIWKAAVNAWRDGELPVLPDELAEASEEQNANYQEQDPWTEQIRLHLNRRKAEGMVPAQVPDLLEAIGVPTERQGNREAKRVRQIAEALGWTYGRKRINGKQERGIWPPVPTAVPTVPTAVPTTVPTALASDANGSAPLCQPRQPKTEETKKQKPEHSTQPSSATHKGESQKRVARVARVAQASDCNGFAGGTPLHAVGTPLYAGGTGGTAPLPSEETLQRLAAFTIENPEVSAAQLALWLDPEGSEGIDGRKVRSWLAAVDIDSYLF